jgi:hypothetical protein
VLAVAHSVLMPQFACSVKLYHLYPDLQRLVLKCTLPVNALRAARLTGF